MRKLKRREKKNKEMDKLKEELNPTEIQTLVERCDVKIATHVGAMVAIVFGSFALLSVVEGTWWLLPENKWVLYLLFIEGFAFPLGILYCLSRGIYYSRMAEKIKTKRLSDKEKVVTHLVLGEMPRLVRWFINIRLKRLDVERIVWLIPIVWILWGLIIFVVATL